MIDVPSTEDIVKAQIEVTKLRYIHWIHHEVFTWQWWIIVIVFIVSWVIWWILIDKKRLLEMISHAIILSYIVTILDATGTEMGVWTYHYKEVPLYHRMLSLDIGALPVIYTLIYQTFNKWKTFITAQLIMSGIFAFLFEPLLIWMNIYKPMKWEHAYSFPIYILIGVLMKWMMGKIVGIQKGKND